MRVTQILLMFISVIGMTLAWRSQNQSGSSGIQVGGPKRISGGEKTRHQTTEHHKKPEEQTEQHFNIGLIVPHTNFGKREYQRAIGSAVQSLQKMRETKLPFLRDVDFSGKNVHFDMILLTPSPTSKCLTSKSVVSNIFFYMYIIFPLILQQFWIQCAKNFYMQMCRQSFIW